MKPFLVVLLPLMVYAQVDTIWANRWTSPGAMSDWGYAIAMDDSGYVYVTGTTENSGTNNDWTTIKYGLSGDTVWVRNFASPGTPNERASSIVVAPSGNLYLTGYTMSSSAGDYFTIKYRANGDTAWTRRYNGTGNGYDFAHWVSIDAQENVYVTGYSRGASYQDDIATVKYDSSGNQVWVNRINGSGNYNDKGHKVIADNQGYVYVTGYVNPFSTGTRYDCLTAKLNAQTGDTIWVRIYNGTADSSDQARDICVDQNGNVYITGSVRNLNTGTDIITIKYDSLGNQQWAVAYNNPDTSGADGGYGIKVDGAGNVYVVGQSQGLGTGSDIVLIKYDADGNEQWVQRYNGPANNYDTPSDEVGGKCMAMDQYANIYIGGTSRGLTTYNDYIALMYDSSGALQWAATYDFSDSLDFCLGLACHPTSGEVAITGRTISTPTYYDMGSVKFKATLTNVGENTGFVANQNCLCIFPNPFRNHCIIKSQTPNPKFQTNSKTQISNPSVQNSQSVTLKIYDASGRVVRSFALNPEHPVLCWDGADQNRNIVPSGVYFVRVKIDTKYYTEKIIKLK
ncbi:MAG: SBBP repeat-containing protein [candidate division WOR-3 bacterium]